MLAVTEIKNKKIFFSPLHWGLGHATRSIPIIKHLLNQHFEVITGLNSPLKEIFETEFPGLTNHKVPKLNVTFGKTRSGTLTKLIIQGISLPRIINEENAWITSFVKENKPDLIISDNRYGFYHKDVKSILITHQLQTPGFGLGGLSAIILKNLIKPFDEIWVPDYEDRKLCLAGAISQNTFKNLNIKYIGPLSRFDQQVNPQEKSHILFLISGPEPQRSSFENLAIKTSEMLKERSVIIRGTYLPGTYTNSEKIRFYDLAHRELLQTLIAKAKLIICRPGYSTVMDLMSFNTPALFIASRGQTEQEYLARYLHDKYGFFSLNAGVNAQQLSKIIQARAGVTNDFNRPSETNTLSGLI